MAHDFKALLTDGDYVKGIDLPQYPASAWQWYSGQPDVDEEDPAAKYYYERVAAVYRVANLSANALANMPFALVDKSGEDFDGSNDWENKVGFMSNPRDLIRKWRLSLFFTNSAYGFIERNRVAVKGLKYLVPTSITPIVDKEGYTGLKHFTRKLGNKVFELPIENILYFFWQDHTTELLPSKKTEFRALMNAAGVLYHADEHIRHFFSRGGIKPTMLMVKGIPTNEEKQNIENIWTKFISGASRYLGKIFNADTMEPVVVGEGIENLKDDNLHRQKIEDIALAAGMPLSLLLANSANYATAQQEYTTWFNNEVVPKADWMAEVMNEQIFKPMGLKWDWRPEVTNEGTQEEQERAGAYSALIASKIKPSAALQILGYEVPKNMEYDDFDEMYFEMLEREAQIRTAAMPQMNVPELPEPKLPKPPQDRVQPDSAVPDNKAIVKTFTMAQYSEAKTWRDIAHRKMKRGDDLQFPFTANDLDEDTAAAIRERLVTCKTDQDIEECFDLNNYAVHPEQDHSDLKYAADALNRAIELTLMAEATS